MIRISVSLATGTITLGGTSQVLDTAKARSYIYIINTSDTVMYINFGAAATTAHIPILAGASWISSPFAIPVNSINVIGAVTGKTFCYLIS
jgi:hypothetical protein